MVIDASHVSMRFRINEDRVSSLKEFIIQKAKGKLKYKEFVALQDVNLSIKKGEVIGIIGSNGAGKSTLLKVIAGILSPTDGSVHIRGTIAPMLELGAGFDPDLTAQENVYLNGAVLGYSKAYLESKYQEIVDFAELGEFMNTPVRNFSSGMTMRLAFSIATLVNPDILIVDEILAVGDAHFQKKSLARMKSLMGGGTTVLLVSHSLQQIRELSTRVLWLEKGRVRALGDTDEICDAYLMSLGEKPLNIMNYRLPWQERLYSPTYMTKINGIYYIVDCWHHRIVYSRELNISIGKWQTIEGLNTPHSIAGNGNMLLVDDGKNDRINCYKQTKDGLCEACASIEMRRPAKIIYDNITKCFYTIGSDSNELCIIKVTGRETKVIKRIYIKELSNQFVRSISVIGERLFIVCISAKIYELNIQNGIINVVQEYTLDERIGGANDLCYYNGYFYLSVYQNVQLEIAPDLVRASHMEDFHNGSYESVYTKLELKGVPYFFSEIDGKLVIGQIDNHSEITFISDKCIEHQFVMGGANPASVERRVKH